MVGPYQILLPLLSIFLVRVDLTDLYPLNYSVKILRIYDGDTVLLQKGSYQFKLRIAKIDSPELGQMSLDGNLNAGEYSKNCLKRILSKDQEHRISISGTDIFGRYLGDLNHVSLEMIRSGCAGLYPLARFKNKHELFHYLRAMKMARDERRGLYKFKGFMQPRKWRKISKRFVRRPLHQ